MHGDLPLEQGISFQCVLGCPHPSAPGSPVMPWGCDSPAALPTQPNPCLSCPRNSSEPPEEGWKGRMRAQLSPATDL